MGRRTVSEAARDLACTLVEDQPRLRRLMARGVTHLWLRPITDGPLAALGVAFDLVEEKTYPHHAPHGSVVVLAGVLFLSGNGFCKQQVQA